MKENELQSLVKATLLKLGENAEAKLAIASDVSVSLIYDVKEGRVPLAKNIVKISVACGLSKERAYDLTYLRDL